MRYAGRVFNAQQSEDTELVPHQVNSSDLIIVCLKEFMNARQETGLPFVWSALEDRQIPSS